MGSELKLLDCRVLLGGPIWPTRKIARKMAQNALARGGGFKGGSASLSETEHVAVVVVPPSQRDWAQHFEGRGVWVVERMPT